MINVSCRPTAAGWAIIALGTPLFLLGWAAVFAPLAARRAARDYSTGPGSGGRHSRRGGESTVRAAG